MNMLNEFPFSENIFSKPIFCLKGKNIPLENLKGRKLIIFLGLTLTLGKVNL